MNKSLKRLLKNKKLGAIVFDIDFNIVEIDEIAADLFGDLGLSLSERNLLTLFPEFFGSESLIKNILEEKNDDFRLDYVNRSDVNGISKFINIFVFPDETASHGLLIVEDATDQALAVQQINQQRYELYLYKHDADFRSRFLSESILGNSATIQQVRETIRKLSSVPGATVLLMGETGSGKNLAARVTHYSSMPAEAPFVDINCAALPEQLLESELFGYEKGAFTHATASRSGLFEEAHGGTIFLDEIGELPLNMQAKLLHVIETKKFRRLGSNKKVEVKARIISATNLDLQKEVKRHRFREDLFYRLNVVSITLPPLRKMGEDILIIAKHLIKIFNIEFKKQVRGFSDDAKQLMLQYPWPGNVRELSNCLERAMIFIATEWIEAHDLTALQPMDAQAASSDPQWTVPPGGIVLEDLERQLIMSALKQAGSNKSKAARLLGLSRDTLRYRLEKYKID
jgi:transcriptional regulator with PAS, ATPase and Fis domain